MNLPTPGPEGFERLLSQALELRSQYRYALHPVEAIVQPFRAEADSPCQQGHGELRFEQAEAHYRAGAQGLRLSEIPQLLRQLRELSRLSTVDRAGRKALRQWAQSLSKRQRRGLSQPRATPWDRMFEKARSPERAA